MESLVVTITETRSAETIGRRVALGAFVGASLAGLVDFADMVLAFVSAFQAVPAATDFAVAELSVVALIAMALGAIAGGLSGLLVSIILRLLRGRSKSTKVVATALIASVPPGVTTAICARLLVTHTDSPMNVIVGLVLGAITAALFAVLWRREQRAGGITLRQWRRPLLICGLIGLAMGALLGFSNSLFTQFDLASMGQIYILSPEFFDTTVPLIPTVFGDAALGASIGLIAAWLAMSIDYFGQRLTRKANHSLITFAATLFIVGGGAGLVGSRLNGLFYPSVSSLFSQNDEMIIAVGDKSVWPQAVLTGIEWGTCAAAIGIVLLVGSSQRLWFPRWRVLIVGILGGSLVAGLLAASIWAGTSISTTGLSPSEAHAVLYPAPFGTSIALGIGALAGLLAAVTSNALIVRAGRWVTPRRAALVAITVVLLIGGVPLLHLAIYPDGEALLPDALSLVFNTGIVLLMVTAAAVLAARWSRPNSHRGDPRSDTTPTELSGPS